MVAYELRQELVRYPLISIFISMSLILGKGLMVEQVFPQRNVGKFSVFDLMSLILEKGLILGAYVKTSLTLFQKKSEFF